LSEAYAVKVAELKERKTRVADRKLALKKELGEVTVVSKHLEHSVRLAKNLADMDVPEDIHVEQRYGEDHADQLEWRVSWEGVRFVMDLRKGTDTSSYPFACPVTAVELETPEFRRNLDAARKGWSPATTPANLVVALHAQPA